LAVAPWLEGLNKKLVDSHLGNREPKSCGGNIQRKREPFLGRGGKPAVLEFKPRGGYLRKYVTFRGKIWVSPDRGKVEIKKKGTRFHA